MQRCTDARQWALNRARRKIFIDLGKNDHNAQQMIEQRTLYNLQKYDAYVNIQCMQYKTCDFDVRHDSNIICMRDNVRCEYWK